MNSGRDIKKVLLIFPPNISYKEDINEMCVPIGLAYLASYIRDICDVKLFDAYAEGFFKGTPLKNKKYHRFGLTNKEILDRIMEYSPDMIGFSCLFSSQYPVISELAELVKKTDSSILTVMGGTHPSFLAEEIINENKNIDYIVKGEGEIALRSLIEAKNLNKRLRSVPGLVFRDEKRKVVFNDPELIVNLDSAGFPARDLLPMELYFKTAIPMGTVFKDKKNTSMITSRGCPYKCVFCSSTNFWQRRYRTRTAENVLDEIGHLIDKYGVKQISFHDDNLTLDKKRAKKIFKGIIDRGYNIRWNTPNGIDIRTLDKELITLMKMSGCFEVTVAVESADQKEMKEVIKKDLDIEEAKTKIRLLKSAGINVRCFFIIGFPGETSDQLKKTIKFSYEMDFSRIAIFIASPLPGSGLSEYAGKDSDEKYIYEYNDFSLVNFSGSEIKSGELERIRKKWFWEYNMSRLIKHPVRFIYDYISVLLKNPLLIKLILKRQIFNC